MKNMLINVRRLGILVLLSLVLPLAGIIILDISLGLMPFLTIGATLIFVPLSTVLVTRATLAELGLVIQAVAPLENNDPD
jgi:hypothetical protein